MGNWLTNDVPEIRKWALIILEVYNDEIDRTPLVPILEKMAFYETNLEVRSKAIIYFAGLINYWNDDDNRVRAIGKNFAEIVLNETELLDLRNSAYKALTFIDSCVLFKMTHDERILAIQKITSSLNRQANAWEGPNFPDGIDWDFVRSWL